MEWGTIPDGVVAAAAVAGLIAVFFALRDYHQKEKDRVQQYAANVGVSVDKAEGTTIVRVKITNGNSAPIYRCVVSALYVPTDGNQPEPTKWFPEVLHPGSCEDSARTDRRAIIDKAEIRFTDGNGRRWVRDSQGSLEPTQA